MPQRRDSNQFGPSVGSRSKLSANMIGSWSSALNDIVFSHEGGCSDVSADGRKVLDTFEAYACQWVPFFLLGRVFH